MGPPSAQRLLPCPFSSARRSLRRRHRSMKIHGQRGTAREPSPIVPSAGPHVDPAPTRDCVRRSESMPGSGTRSPRAIASLRRMRALLLKTSNTDNGNPRPSQRARRSRSRSWHGECTVFDCAAKPFGLGRRRCRDDPSDRRDPVDPLHPLRRSTRSEDDTSTDPAPSTSQKGIRPWTNS